MIVPYVPCGHFALGTLSETCVKVPVFEVNVKQKNSEHLQNPKMSNLTPKSRNVSELDIILSQFTHSKLFLYICNAFLIKFSNNYFVNCYPCFVLFTVSKDYIILKKNAITV